MEMKMPSGVTHTYTERDTLIIEPQDRGFEMHVFDVTGTIQKLWDDFVKRTGCKAKLQIKPKPGFSLPNGQPWSWNGFGDAIAVAALLTFADIDVFLNSLKRKATYTLNDVDFMMSRIIVWGLRDSEHHSHESFEMERDFDGAYPFELTNQYLIEELQENADALRVVYDILKPEM